MSTNDSPASLPDSGKTILLVEDEALIAMDEARMLKNHGFEVITAHNARKAITAVDENNIDLVLMDIALGKGSMDGTEAAEIILEDHDLPIVFLTSHAEKEMVEKVKGITNYGYVLKNSGEFVLLESITMAFELFNTHQELKRENEERKASEQKAQQRLENIRFLAETAFTFIDSKIQDSIYTYIGECLQKLIPGGYILINSFDHTGGILKTEALIGLDTIIDKIITILGFHPVGTSYTVDESFYNLASGRLETFEYGIHELSFGKVPKTIAKSLEKTFNIGKIYAIAFMVDNEIYANATIILPKNREINSRETIETFVSQASIALKRQKTEKRYIDLFEHAPVALWEEDFSQVAHHLAKLRKQGVTDLDHYLEQNPEALSECTSLIKVLDVNAEAVKMAGFPSKQEMIGSLEKTFTSTSEEMLKKELLALWQGKSVVEETGEIMARSGKTRDVLIRWQVSPESRAPYSKVLVSFLDITERRKAEREKDFLMKELNHRVKNNLIMISSLINLKDSALGDEIDLSDISRQIDAIRIVHEKLNQSEEIVHIDVKDYVQHLLETIFSSMTRNNITIENTIDELCITTRKAIPLGLLINELATNAIKYGFPQDEEARFSIDMKKDDSQGQYILTVTNTGNPFPEDVDLKNPQTIGMQLVAALVEQLEGSVELQRKPYPTFTIEFPAEETM